jgi:hypothetical protein
MRRMILAASILLVLGWINLSAACGKGQNVKTLATMRGAEVKDIPPGQEK